VNDLLTVLALGLVFANYNFRLVGFAAAVAVALWFLPRGTPWIFRRLGNRVSEPQIKFVLLILFVLGGLADRALTNRVRAIAFTVPTPFYFLKAGSLVRADVIVDAAGLIAVFLAVKMIAKFVGILPLTRTFRFQRKEGMYTTLLMSTA
jgi:Kef-type K+ transport system membrane component KefB